MYMTPTDADINEIRQDTGRTAFHREVGQDGR